MTVKDTAEWWAWCAVIWAGLMAVVGIAWVVIHFILKFW